MVHAMHGSFVWRPAGRRRRFARAPVPASCNASDKEAFHRSRFDACRAVYATARNLCSSDLEAIELDGKCASERSGPNPRDAGRAVVSGFRLSLHAQRGHRAATTRNAPPFTLLHRFLPATAGGDRSTPSPARFSDVELLAQRPDIARRITDALALLEPEDRAAFVFASGRRSSMTTRRPSWICPSGSCGCGRTGLLARERVFVLPRRARGNRLTAGEPVAVTWYAPCSRRVPRHPSGSLQHNP